MRFLLFVCTANLIRSPLAQAAAQKIVQERGLQSAYRIESAGTWAKNGGDILPATLAMAQKLGLPGLESHRSREIHADLMQAASQVIVMTQNQREALLVEFSAQRQKIMLLSEWGRAGKFDIPDPAEGLDSLEAVAQLIVRLCSRAEYS